MKDKVVEAALLVAATLIVTLLAEFTAVTYTVESEEIPVPVTVLPVEMEEVDDNPVMVVLPAVVVPVTTVITVEYVGVRVGETVGALLGCVLGSGVGEPSSYVGLRVGDAVGSDVGV